MGYNILKKATIVVSVFNEEKVLELFWAELEKHLKKLNVKYEVIFVNDGSTDQTLEILKKLLKRDENIRIINFSTNFGHEAAMTAGLNYSSGNVTICMDADLQHPPSKIGMMLDKFADGYEIVNMARIKNEDVGSFKSILTTIFYYILNIMSPVNFEPRASDFFLVSSRVAHILNERFTERTRFLRGFIQIIGFQKTTIEYVAAKRVTGESNYSFLKLFMHAIMAIATFSKIPLHFGVFLGLIIAILSISLGLFSIVVKLLGFVIPGFTTMVVLISFLFAIQLIIIGIIGEYLGFLFCESKNRPIYIIKEKINF